MAKATIIPDVRYVGGGQTGRLRSGLKYYQYREGSARMAARQRGVDYPQQSWEALTHVKDDDRPRTFDPRTGKRWVDRGLGDSYQTILKRCTALEGEQILARTWVISPAPDLMAAVDEKRRLRLLAEVTEEIVERFYEDMDWGQPAYSYVMHTRQTNPTDAQGRAQAVQQQLHSHVITPGTHAGFGFEWEAQPRFVPAERLHELSREIWGQVLEREIGRERLARLLTERELEHDRFAHPALEDIEVESPAADLSDEATAVDPAWGGVWDDPDFDIDF